MKLSSILTLAAWLTAFALSDASAQTYPRIVNQLGGSANAVAEQNGLLYWGMGPRLMVGRWDGNRIAILGQSPVMPRIVRDVEVEGDFAYVTDGNGLQIVNVADPARPALSGYFDSPGAAFDAAVNGGFAYLADGLPGVRVVNVQDPVHPFETAEIPVVSGATGVAVEGSHLVAVDGSFGIRVYELSNPSAPSEIASLPVDFLTGPIHVDGDFAYVSFDEGAVRDGGFIIDISDPSHPRQRGAYLARDPIRDVAVNGDRLYAVDGYGLWVFDISDPDNPGAPVDPVHPLSPHEIGTPGEASGLVLDFPHAFVADGGGGMRAYDVTYPRGIAALDAYNPVGQAFGLSIDGTLGVVAGGQHGLRFLDMTDPARPGLLGTVNPALDLEFAVVLNGRYAYAAGSGNGNAGRSLYVIDAADPRRPTEIRAALMNTGGLGLAANDTNVFVGGGVNGMQVVNVTDPTLAVQQTYATSIAFAQGVAVEGNLAFLASWGGQFGWDAGLRIYDVSDLADPAARNVPLLGYVPTAGGEAVDVAVERGFAYVVDRQGLKIVDATDPSNASVVGSLNTPGNANAVAVADSFAYVLDERSFRVVDATEPRAPREVGSVEIPGLAADVEAAGAYAYVASYEGGLYVVQLEAVAGDAPPADAPAEDPTHSGDVRGGGGVPVVTPGPVSVNGGCGCRLDAAGSGGLKLGDAYVFLVLAFIAGWRLVRFGSK